MGSDINILVVSQKYPIFLLRRNWKVDCAVLLDGGFIKRKMKSSKVEVSANNIEHLSKILIASILKDNDKCNYRIYYYDAPPCKDVLEKPISKEKYELSKTRGYPFLIQFLDEIKKKDFFAVREGVLSFIEWGLSDRDKIITKDGYVIKEKLDDEDFKPIFKQKGVDTKIGLDIAWISYTKVAERIILVAGDSDFVPAIKMARRNGIFVHLFTLGHGIHKELAENVDTIDTRTVIELLQ